MATIGRPGRGPGKLARATMPTSHGGSHCWVAVEGDTLAVFDGERVSLFRRDGTLLATCNPHRVRGASPMQSRVARTGGECVFTAGGYDPMAGARQQHFEIHATRGDRPRTVARISLPPLPNGMGMSSEQARPRWEVGGRCIVLSDGTSPWLVRADRKTGAADTIPLPLPDRDPPRVPEDERMASRKAGARGGPADPSAPLLVRDLVMTRTERCGSAPCSPRPRWTASRCCASRARRARCGRDTVPTFPLAFGAPGVCYTVEYSPDGVPLIVRYEAAR